MLRNLNKFAKIVQAHSRHSTRFLTNESFEKQPVSSRVRQIQKEADEQRERLRWRKGENAMVEEYNSKLNLINNQEQTSDYITMMQQPFDFNIKRIYKNMQEKKERAMQQFIPERHDTLGPDLATAHFVLFRGGAVKFKHKADEWLRANEDKEFNLPTKYDDRFKLIAVDCSNMNLYYEGLENIVALRDLKYLSFKNIKNFDDWCLDRVSGSYLPQIEELDISGTNVTHNGFSCIYRLSTLKKLILTAANSIDFQLTSAMLEESLPHLEIITTVNEH